MVAEIVGRELELTVLRTFIDDAEGASAALILEGEAGIGKSVLCVAGVDYARSRGLNVLSCRPAEAERELGYVGLVDLLEPVVAEVLPALSPPRRRALQVALLQAEPSGDPVDPRTLGIAVRDALQVLADRAPALLVVDDVQWLDPESSRALAFAIRRLGAARVKLLLARRAEKSAARSELERALDTARVRHVAVGPLSLGALHRLLRDQLHRPLARQTLIAIQERSAGNPFFALELARVLPEDVHPLEPLPVPETVEELLGARISALPATTRDALALAAAMGTTSESLLERAGVLPAALDAAVAARVVERSGGTVRFTHPLLASVLYHGLGDEREKVHARIAEIVDDPVLRARHLALSRATPDADVVRLLDAAASLANDRGAAALAADLAEHALRLTPATLGDERPRRALATARAQLAAGEWTRARTIASDLLAGTDNGPLRAETLLVLAEFEHDDLAVPVLEEALLHAASDPSLHARIHIRLGWAERFRNGFAAAGDHTHAALELAERVDDDGLRFRALMNLNRLGSMVGDTNAPEYAARAREVAAATGDARLLREANVLLHGTFVDPGDLDARRAILEREYRDWSERDELFSADLLWELSWVEFWGERWALAAEHAARSRELSLQYGVERNQDYIPSSWVAVHRGDLDLARREATRALKLCEEQIGFYPPLLQAVPGLVDLWRGNAAAAVNALGNADRQASALGWRLPDARPWTPDYAEALLELGRIGEAANVIDRWEADASRLGRQRVLAHVTRCRGLVAAARGTVGDARALFELAVAQHEAVSDSFGRARALLALGVVRRRERQKLAARDAISAALAGFEQLGAAGWAERARHELGRIGGRTREDGLTAAERRVAALVVEGRTNQEVAAALFVAERTVANHLTHIYAKLGVRSRTQLARKVGNF